MRVECELQCVMGDGSFADENDMARTTTTSSHDSLEARFEQKPSCRLAEFYGAPREMLPKRPRSGRRSANFRGQRNCAHRCPRQPPTRFDAALDLST